MTSLPRMHHVLIAMPAGREDDARAFYCDLLGLEEIPKPATLVGRGGVWFRTGTLDLHLGIDHDFIRARKAHVALAVDDLTDMQERIVASGRNVTPDDELPGFARFYVDDPFGNRLEILSPVI